MLTSRLGLAPDRISASLVCLGLLAMLGAASLELGRTRTSEDEALSPYGRASWGGSGESAGLASVLYVGHLVGPMLLLAALAHARLRQREQAEALGAHEEEVLLPPPTADDAPRTLRRLSVILPRAEAHALHAELRHEPAHAHRAIPALARAIARAGHLEHVDHVLGQTTDRAAIDLERLQLERRVLGAPTATYRDVERPSLGPTGDHAVLSFVLVTRTDLDPLVDVPEWRALDAWLAEMFPLRPEETIALDAFVTPRDSGVDVSTLSSVLELERLRGESPARARAA